MNLDFSVVWEYKISLMQGLWATTWISFVSIFIGFFLGLGLYVLGCSKFKPFNIIVKVYVSFFRGTPLLVQLLIVFLLLPEIGIDMPMTASAILALSMNTGAFQSEILRGGFTILPKGQTESCWVLGLNQFQSFFFIKLPQVIKVTIPALINESIDIIKNSCLISVVGVMELMRATDSGYSNTYRPIEFFVVAAGLYLILTTCVSYFGTFMESRLNRNEGSL